MLWRPAESKHNDEHTMIFYDLFNFYIIIILLFYLIQMNKWHAKELKYSYYDGVPKTYLTFFAYSARTHVRAREVNAWQSEDVAVSDS